MFGLMLGAVGGKINVKKSESESLDIIRAWKEFGIGEPGLMKQYCRDLGIRDSRLVS